MLDEIVSYITDGVIKKGGDYDKDVISYGIHSMLMYIIIFSSLLILSSLFGYLLECVLFLIIYSPLRMYAGGYHSTSRVYCYFASTIIILFLIWISLFVFEHSLQRIVLGMTILSEVVMCKYAPIGTINKPLDMIELKYFKKKLMKLLIGYNLLIFLLMGVQLEYLAVLICTCIILSAVLVTLETIRVSIEIKKNND